MDESQDWKKKVMIIGAAVGLLTGLGAAYLYIQRADEMAEKPKLTSGEGMKLGLGLVGILKMITELGPK
jgi:hypothetical protein